MHLTFLFIKILVCSSFLRFQLQELQDKYAECMEMLHEAQEELKNLRNKTLPLSTPRRFHSLGLFPMVREGVKGCLNANQLNTRDRVSVSQYHCGPISRKNSCTFFCLQDSLAAEIEGTMRKELQMDDPDVEEQRYIQFSKSGLTILMVCNNLIVTNQFHCRVSAGCIQSECSRQ